jgi:hypothetical protein
VALQGACSKRQSPHRMDWQLCLQQCNAACVASSKARITWTMQLQLTLCVHLNLRPAGHPPAADAGQRQGTDHLGSAAAVCVTNNHTDCTLPIFCCSQAIKKLQMLDTGKAQIDWTLSGGLSGMTLTIPTTSVFELNLVTGRVTSHTWVGWRRVCCLRCLARMVDSGQLYPAGCVASSCKCAAVLGFKGYVHS